MEGRKVGRVGGKGWRGRVREWRRELRGVKVDGRVRKEEVRVEHGGENPE